MKHRYAVCLVLVALLVAVPCAAEVEWSVQKELKLDAAPLDLAISSGGQWVFVLAADGRVYVFSADGVLNDKFEVGPGVDALAAGPQEETLYLLNRKKGTVEVVQVEFIREIDTAGCPVRGPEDAPVTMILFTDFQCPYCARLVPLLDQVLKANPETVKLVFKNFPLRSHQFAVKAAAAALAANQMGKFWEFHDLLFQNYNRLNDEKINEIATTLGLDAQKFAQEQADPAIMQQIRSDFQQGVDAGVRGTPTVFINGRMLRERSLEGFQAAINQALGKGAASTGAAGKKAAENQ